MKLFKCDHCGNPVYFENEHCERCGYALGFAPAADAMLSFDPDGAPPAGMRQCANAQHHVCNWLVEDDGDSDFCEACRHNRVIPDLTVPDHRDRWRAFESAKHRVFYSLRRFGLRAATRSEDPAFGLAFDFLAESPELGAPRILTGHDDGVITFNLKEADDSEREKSRFEMGETYRTVLGHFRHEIGHYFWDRLVKDQPALEPFRALFGDETAHYAHALHAHYSMGAPPDWQSAFISSYASSHPWEDFAESWAHYFHIVDTLETAASFGLRVNAKIVDAPSHSARIDFDPYCASIEQLIGAWLPLTFAMNAMNRSMGEPDLYPFILSEPAIAKISFVRDLVASQARRAAQPLDVEARAAA